MTMKNLHEKIGNYIIHNIFFFTLTLPGILYGISAFIPLENKMDFNISFGSCLCFQLSYNLSIKSFFIILSGFLNIFFLLYALIMGWVYKDNKEIRNEVYKTWKKRSITSIVLLLFLLLNTICFSDGNIVKTFNLDSISVLIFLFLSIMFFILARIGEKETKN